MADAVSELRRELHKRGYDTKREGAHYKVYNGDGNVVRTKKGQPLSLPTTPSDRRALNNSISNLRDAGVLPRPRVVRTQKKVPRTTLIDQSAELRGELRAAMEEYKLSQAEVSHYADYYAGQHGISVPSFGQGVVSKFLKGTYLSPANYMWLSSALHAIKAEGGKIPKGEALKEKIPQPSEDVGVEVEGESHVPIKAPLPDLALETMSMIYREDRDHDAILDLIHRIARLELG
jgi:hypothetical protein